MTRKQYQQQSHNITSVCHSIWNNLQHIEMRFTMRLGEE